MQKFLHVHLRPSYEARFDEEENEEEEEEAGAEAEAEADDEVPPEEGEEEFAAEAAEAEEIEEAAAEPGVDADTVKANWVEHLVERGVEEEELPSDNEQLFFKLKEHEGNAARCRHALRERGCGEYYLNEKCQSQSRGGIVGKAAEVIELCHYGTFEELAQFAFSKEGAQFADAAAWRTQWFADRQRKFQKGCK